MDMDKARDYGLKPGDLRRASARLMAGEEMGDIYVEGRTYDVQVWTPPRLRHNVEAYRQMLFDTPSGQRVRLGEVADVRILPTPDSIKREGGSRRIDVQANLGDRDLASVAADVEARLARVEWPLGYHAVLTGEIVELRAARTRLLLLSILSAVGIYFLLQVSLRSWRLATLSFLSLPSALVGGVLATYAAVGVISLGSLVGFLTVLGIAARNGILMIDHFQHLERHEGEPFGMGLVLRGANERLRPIVMTAGTTALALVPLVVYGNLPGHEIEHPMAVVILGGLVTSTLLNLFVVPALYLRFGAGVVRREDSADASRLSASPG
jgi:Cu/Ag efflux pump CusA